MSEEEKNDYLHANTELVGKVRDSLPDDDMLIDLSELFKVFGDSTRVKILCVLLETEMCVNDIADLLGMSMSAISHQLRVLKASQLIKFRREGRTVFYSLADDHVRTIISQGLDHVGE